MKARVYRTTVEFDIERLRITTTRYLCVEAPDGKMHLTNAWYKDYDSADDVADPDGYATERDDLWDHLGSCDGSCVETFDFPDDDYAMILEMAKTNAMVGCSRYPLTDSED